MGGPVFDRQVFVKQKASQPRPSKSLLPGGLALLIVAALSAFATYRFVKAGGTAPSDSADKAKIQELQTKLKQTQALIDELQSRRRSRHVVSDAGHINAQTDAAKTKNALLASAMPNPAGGIVARPSASIVKPAVSTAQPLNNKTATTGDTHAAPPASPAAAPGASPSAPAPVVPAKELTELQGNLEASHEEWEATANRLGNVVGELDSQRTALQKTQTGVNYLLERAQRSDISFTLRKGMGLQHVGPIAMELGSTSVKGQHYSLRMIVDDKSVVLKDRALNEVIQFYTARSQYPLRLIVSQIDREQVSGTLAVPSGLEQESNNHQLQER
jgi:hypothetical protein